MATKISGKDAVGVFNTTRENLSPVMQTAVPMATPENIATATQPILDHAEVANAFYTTLMNLIGYTYVEYRPWTNPLNMFKRGTNELGSDVREIAINFMDSKDYDITGQRLLTNEAPDLKTCYYRLNRQEVYEVSQIRSELKLAFSSWDTFGTLVARITDNLFRSNELGEYSWTRDTLNGAISSGDIATAQIAKPTDASTANAFAKLVKQISREMTFPGTQYAPYNMMKGEDPKPFKTATPKDEQVLILTPSVEASIDVDSLAVAYNQDRVEFMGRVIVVDSLAESGTLKPYAMLCDSAFVRIWDNERYFDSFINPANMSQKFFLHMWQTYGWTPFANCIAFIEPTA